MLRIPCTSLACLIVSSSLAACAAPQSPGGLGSAAQPLPAMHARGQSWMLPAAKKSALLYVSSVLSGDVYVYSYSTHTLMGTLTGFTQPYGLCVDKAANVWIANDGASSLVEYAHGGTSPIATLSDPNEYPEGCSVDPKTGNLAVTNFFSTTGSGSVAIYTGATGTPTLYSDPSMANYRFCGYDPHGNLFVDGVNSSSKFVFAELPAGGSTFTNINFAQSIEWPGGVQWDGKHITVGDTDTTTIYQTDASGKIEGSTKLAEANYVNQFWIVVDAKHHKKSKVVAPSQDAGDVGIYSYPAGGSPTATISVSEPFGAVISK